MPVDEEYSYVCYINGNQVYRRDPGFVDADLVLLITIANFTSGTLTFVKKCVSLNQSLTLPLLDSLDLYINTLSKTVDDGFYRAVIMHELLHMLLFALLM